MSPTTKPDPITCRRCGGAGFFRTPVSGQGSGIPGACHDCGGAGTVSATFYAERRAARAAAAAKSARIAELRAELEGVRAERVAALEAAGYRGRKARRAITDLEAVAFAELHGETLDAETQANADHAAAVLAGEATGEPAAVELPGDAARAARHAARVARLAAEGRA